MKNIAITLDWKSAYGKKLVKATGDCFDLFNRDRDKFLWFFTSTITDLRRMMIWPQQED